MTESLSRARVEATLQHREPDRVPIDVNPHADLYAALKRYLGLEIDEDPQPNKAMEVIPHPRVLRTLGVNCQVSPGSRTALPFPATSATPSVPAGESETAAVHR